MYIVQYDKGVDYLLKHNSLPSLFDCYTKHKEGMYNRLLLIRVNNHLLDEGMFVSITSTRQRNKYFV